jgi:hypothetical protein
MACTSCCDQRGEEKHINSLRYFRFKSFALLVQYGTPDAIHNSHDETPRIDQRSVHFHRSATRSKKNSSGFNFDVILMKQPTRKLHSLIV